MTDTELFGIEPPQEAVNMDGLRNMFCGIIARSVADARNLRKAGHITAESQPNFPRGRGKADKPIRLLGFYSGAAAIQELIDFIKVDLNVLLTEAGLDITSHDVMADIDLDCMGKRTLPPCEYMVEGAA